MKSLRSSWRYSSVALLVAGILVVAIAGYLLFFVSKGWFGFDAGTLAGVLFPAGIWSCLHTLAKCSESGNSMGSGEKQAIVALLVTALAGAYLWWKLSALGWEINPRDREFGKAVGHVIIMLIASAVLGGFARKWERQITGEDERDVIIRRRAAAHSHVALVVLVIVLIVAIGNASAGHALSSSVVIAHVLIGTLLISELIRHAWEIWLYRVDRE